MEMTPLDIRNQEFRRKTFGGLDPEEVTAFLSQVAAEYESRLRESQENADKLKIAKEQISHFKSIEGSLQETALTLQKVLEEKKVQAQKEAEFIIAEAKNNAYKETEAIRRESETLRTEIVGLRAQKAAFFSRIRNALRTQEELLQAMEKDSLEHDSYDAQEAQALEHERALSSQGRIKRQAVRDIRAKGPGLEEANNFAQAQAPSTQENYLSAPASSAPEATASNAPAAQTAPPVQKQPAQSSQAATTQAPSQAQAAAAVPQSTRPAPTQATSSNAGPQVRQPTPGAAPARRAVVNPGPSELPEVASTGIKLEIDQPGQ